MTSTIQRAFVPKLCCDSSRLARRIAKSLAESMPAQSSCATRNTGESVGELIRAVRHEEAKVHLDLPSLMKARTFAIAHSLELPQLLSVARAYLWTR